MYHPRLVLLRASWLDRAGWDGVVARLPGFADPLTIDVPVTTGVDVVPRLADHVAAELAALRVRGPHVVGHSLAAAVALELACRVPVAAVTAFCAVGFRDPGHHSWNSARIRTQLRLAGGAGPRARAGLSRYACRYTFPRPRRLAGTPVNLVWAERDRVVPPADAARARAALPHADHVVMPDCGHLVQCDDQNGTAAVLHACHVALMLDGQRRAG